MIRSALGGWLLMWGCNSCRSCQPELPDTDVDTDVEDSSVDTDPDDTDTDIPDTDLPAHCLVNGFEPDSPSSPTTLPFEQLACGEFANPVDADWWDFDVELDGWVKLRVDARTLGSRADPAVVITRDGAPWADARDLNDGVEDVLLKFPALAGHYQVFVNEELLAGGPDEFFYEMLISKSKPPVDAWDIDDTEPNNTSATAQLLPDAAKTVILGGADVDADLDVYKIHVPSVPERATYTFDVDAYEFGSPADFRLDIRDSAGTLLSSVIHGQEGWERDPWGQIDSFGDEDLFVTVREELSHEGPAYWYLLTVTREVE